MNHFTSKELTTPIGQLIRSYFERPSFTPVLKALLFAADRMQRLEQEIEPALKSDIIVLADRWTLSALAYRIVEGLDKQYVLQVNSLVRLPDVTVLLDIPSDESLKRGQIAGKSCPYSTDFLEAARQCYLELADQFQVPIVDGLQPLAQVSAEIMKILSDKIGDL